MLCNYLPQLNFYGPNPAALNHTRKLSFSIRPPVRFVYTDLLVKYVLSGVSLKNSVKCNTYSVTLTMKNAATRGFQRMEHVLFMMPGNIKYILKSREL